MSKSILSELLELNPPDKRREVDKKSLEILRLSKLAGKPVVFQLRGLNYDEVEALRIGSGTDRGVHIVLAGCEELKSGGAALREKYDVLTNAEAVKALLTPGEIEDLASIIERLSGFRMRVVAEVKNA